MCGFYDVSVAKFGQIDNLITGAENFGTQEDVFDGFDFTFNARLQNQAFLSGGLSLGRQRTNTCYAMDDRSLLFAATSPRTTPFCDVRPPMQPNVKLQGVYPLPWWGIETSATFQSLPGPQILAQQETTNAQILPSLGRNLASCGAAAVCNATRPAGPASTGHAVRRPHLPGRRPVQQDGQGRPNGHSSDGVRLQPPQRKPGAVVQQPVRSVVAGPDWPS